MNELNDNEGSNNSFAVDLLNPFKSQKNPNEGARGSADVASRDQLLPDRHVYAETDLVRLVLGRLGLLALVPEVVAVVSRDSGAQALPGELTFDALHEVASNLPMRFASPPATGFFKASQPQLADLLVNPDRARLVFLHQQERDALQLPDAYPLGLVFRYGGARGGWVLHDGTVERFGPGHRLLTQEHGELIMSRFYGVLDHIIAHPHFDADPPVAEETVRPFDHGLPVRPAVRHRLGCGVASQLYGLLEQMHQRRLCGWLCERVLVHDDERWARLSHVELADFIGCGPDAVKSAVARLVCDGYLLRSPRTVHGNMYRVVPLNQVTAKEVAP